MACTAGASSEYNVADDEAASENPDDFLDVALLLRRIFSV